MTHLAVFAFLVIAWSQMRCSAATWIEYYPAGDLPDQAQRTLGSEPLTAIVGGLEAIDEVDMYLIRIVNPLAFSARTVDILGFVPDPRLFLFGLDARGVYANDDATGSQSELPAAHPLSPVRGGLYYLAIARFANAPLSAGGEIFGPMTGVVGPTGPGGSGRITGWDRNVFGPIDFDVPYAIELTGAVPAGVPEPATLLLTALPLASLAATALVRRRRV